MKFFAVLIALFGMLGSFLAAQDARKVKFRVLCYEHSQNVLKAMVAGDEGASQEVSFYTGGFGPQMVGVFAGGQARFYTETTGPDGKPQRKTVAEGNLLASDSQVFLLFPESQKEGLVYKILAFDDGEGAFAMGSTRVINLAPVPARLNLAGTELPAIKPGGVQVYPQVKKVDDWNMFTARIEIAAEADKWLQISTQSWKASDQKRDWVIVYFSPQTQSPDLRFYQDIPPWRRGVQVVTPNNG